MDTIWVCHISFDNLNKKQYLLMVIMNIESEIYLPQGYFYLIYKIHMGVVMLIGTKNNLPIYYFCVFYTKKFFL
jgi:hypothetical protein